MLKQGTKLQSRANGTYYHIGGVCGEIYFVIDSKDEAYCPLTESEVRKHFDIIEEKWEPKMGESYYILGDMGTKIVCTWRDDGSDHFRRDNLGIYRTREEVPTSYKFKQ